MEATRAKRKNGDSRADWRRWRRQQRLRAARVRVTARMEKNSDSR